MYAAVEDTYEAVILAADRASTAGVAAAHADDVDRRAGQADKSSNVLDSHADGTEDGRQVGRLGLKHNIMSAAVQELRVNTLHPGQTGSTGWDRCCSYLQPARRWPGWRPQEGGQRKQRGWQGERTC